MRAIVLSSAFAVAVVVGCSAAPGGNTFTGSGADGTGANGTGGAGRSTGTTTDTGIGGGFGSSSGTSSGGTPGCSAASQLVYVLSRDNHLYSFQPAMKQFTLIGQLGCNVPLGATPNSMAVDRNADAWVNYVSSFGPIDTAGSIYKVSTADASCASAATVTLPDASWYRLGMGFSTDASGGTTETLYVTGTGTHGMSNSPGLGKIDFGTNSLVPIHAFTGDSTLAGQSAELTGTGDARLFGFFTTSPVRVAQIDKTAGAILSDMQVGNLPTPMAWAFSFWGGAFYLYTSDGTANSTVTRFDPTTMAVDSSYVLTAPTVIDGAGVSTCAPLTQTQ